MDDEFDLGDLYASTRAQEEARERQAVQARLEAEEAKRRAKEAHEAEAKALQEAQRLERQARIDQLAAMNPVRRWVTTHRLATGILALLLVASATAAAISVLSARQAEQRFQNLLASCDESRTREVPPEDLGRFIASWATCAEDDPRAWAATQARGEDSNVLEALAGDPSPKVRMAVATNAATPTSALAILANDSEESIRLVMAERQVNLDLLASDTSSAVRLAVARASDLSDSAMERLAQDSSLEVQQALLERSDLSPNARVILAQNPNAVVCSRAANALRNPMTSGADQVAWVDEVLQAASTCGDTATRVLAAELAARDKALSVLTELANDEEVEVRRVVAEKADSARLLSGLANDPYGYIRSAVARNRATPAEILTELSTDPDPDVRRGVAYNLETPDATAEKLATDTDYDVRLAISKRPDVTPAALDLLANAPEADIRVAIAGNPSAPASALARLATDVELKVQSAVVRNPGATTEVLLVLCSSDRILLRAKARDRIDPEFYRQCLERAIYS